jgi:hypothetical protein
VRVHQGATLYIKYYSDAGDAALHYTTAGRKWGAWRTMGPVLAHNIGTHPNDPVILKITEVGTSNSTVTWANGRGKCGTWSGLLTTGPYDLAIDYKTRWTRPPIIVTEPKIDFVLGKTQ